MNVKEPIRQVDIEFPEDRSAFLEAATANNEACVSVGGLAMELGMLHGAAPRVPRVLGQLVEYARRSRGLTVEGLVREADIDLTEALAIERDPEMTPSSRAVYQVAGVLGLPAGKLMELAGLAEARDENLGRAALRFAAHSEPTSQLSKDEREALEEFVKVLAEATDRG